jgi:hypothetical protein
MYNPKLICIFILSDAPTWSIKLKLPVMVAHRLHKESDWYQKTSKRIWFPYYKASICTVIGLLCTSIFPQFQSSLQHPLLPSQDLVVPSFHSYTMRRSKFKFAVLFLQKESRLAAVSFPCFSFTSSGPDTSMQATRRGLSSRVSYLKKTSQNIFPLFHSLDRQTQCMRSANGNCHSL